MRALIEVVFVGRAASQRPMSLHSRCKINEHFGRVNTRTDFVQEQKRRRQWAMRLMYIYTNGLRGCSYGNVPYTQYISFKSKSITWVSYAFLHPNMPTQSVTLLPKSYTSSRHNHPTACSPTQQPPPHSSVSQSLPSHPQNPSYSSPSSPSPTN